MNREIKWGAAPWKIEFNPGMVLADIEITPNETLTVYCHESQTKAAEALLGAVPQQRGAVTITYDDVVKAWDAQADARNGFGALSVQEMVEFAIPLAIEAERQQAGVDVPDGPPASKPLTDERTAFKQYIDECDKCGIVPDAAGAFHAAWQAAHGIKGDV